MTAADPAAEGRRRADEFLTLLTAGTPASDDLLEGLTEVRDLVFVVGQMVWLLPGTWGEWVAKSLPGNSGSAVTTPVSFNPLLLDPWTGFAVFAAEIAAVLLVGLLVFRRRDA